MMLLPNIPWTLRSPGFPYNTLLRHLLWSKIKERDPTIRNEKKKMGLQSFLQIKIISDNPVAYTASWKKNENWPTFIHWVRVLQLTGYNFPVATIFFFFWPQPTSCGARWMNAPKSCPWSGIFKRIDRVCNILIMKINLPQRGWAR